MYTKNFLKKYDVINPSVYEIESISGEFDNNITRMGGQIRLISSNILKSIPQSNASKQPIILCIAGTHGKNTYTLTNNNNNTDYDYN